MNDEARGLAMALLTPDACPDPAGHHRLYVERETTWREDRAGVVRSQGLCGWCGCRDGLLDVLTELTNDPQRSRR